MGNPFWSRDDYRKLTWRERLGWHDHVHAFVRDLLETKGRDDSVTERHVQHVLRSVRLQRAAQPWIELGKTIVTPLEKFWSTMHYMFERAAADEVPPVIDPGNAGALYAQQQAQAGLFSAYGGGFTAQNMAPHIPGTAYYTSTIAPPFAGASYPGTTQHVFEDAGISTGEVNAFRAWFLHDDGLLHSMYMSDFAWAPGIPVEGEATSHADGVHAFKSRGSVLEYARGYSFEYPIVIGTVDLWGTVYEHERGYRASHAAIASIDDAPSLTEDGGVTFIPTYDAAKLRKKYRLDEPKPDPAV